MNLPHRWLANSYLTRSQNQKQKTEQNQNQNPEPRTRSQNQKVQCLALARRQTPLTSSYFHFIFYPILIYFVRKVKSAPAFENSLLVVLYSIFIQKVQVQVLVSHSQLQVQVQATEVQAGGTLLYLIIQHKSIWNLVGKVGLLYFPIKSVSEWWNK